MAQPHLVQPAGFAEAVRKAVFDLEDDLTNAEVMVEALATVIEDFGREGGKNRPEHLIWLAEKAQGTLAEHVEGLRRQFRTLAAMTRAHAGDDAAGEVRP